MAKVQGKKKTAAASRRAARKVAARVKSAARAARAARAIKKKVAARPAAAKARKAARKTAEKVTKAVKRAAASLPAKPTAVPPPAPKGPVARHVPPVPKPVPEKKTRTRRPRPRVQSNGTPVAAWLKQGVDKPRPSSFIPAPQRAEAPSLIAAPPASSDRLIRPEDVTEFVTRTQPVRIDVEQGGGRVFISVNPEEITLRPGEGIEWDFRYLGGADVIIDEIVLEFEKPSPFAGATFRSRKPGPARPHRQLSGAVHKAAAGKRLQYTVRAMNAFKTELANRKLFLNVAT
ncbi:MAG TPA: hypothetical protein VF980_06735 [Thermoanaerobaculia bacterium]